MERLSAGAEWQDTGFVFTTKRGKPIDLCNAGRYRRRLLEKAGLRPCRFHDLRHTAATLLLAQGVHGRTVMELLGHSAIGVTLNLYSHVLPRLKDEAAEKMDAALSHRRN
jgi:integrase